MVELRGESGGAFHGGEDWRGDRSVEFNLCAAGAAVQVTVLHPWLKVVGLAPINAMVVPGQAKLLEQVKGAVHR